MKVRAKLKYEILRKFSTEVRPLAIVVGMLLGCGEGPLLTDIEKLSRVEEMVSVLEKRFPDVETITVDEVGRLLEKDSVVLVDVREAKEQKVSMIPGAISVEEFEDDEDRYEELTVVAYCTIGHRSSEYAQQLTQRGRRVLNLRGSILAWAHAGGPLVLNSEATRTLHVYGSNWDLAPNRFETVW